MAYWLIVENLQNWEHDRANGFRYFGLPKHRLAVADTMAVGDPVIVYVAKTSCFSDIREVANTKLVALKGVASYDFPFEFGIETRPVVTLPREKWINVSDVKDQLEMTRDLKSWAIAFRQSMRQLSDHDGQLLKKLLAGRR